MDATTEKKYTLRGKTYSQRMLTPLRCQALSLTEAWQVMTAEGSTGLEIYMSPKQCAEFFNAVLIPEINGQTDPEKFPEFTEQDFAYITLSEVGEVFGHFCFFNPILMPLLPVLTALSEVLESLPEGGEAGGLGAPSIGSISQPQPAAETLPN